MLYIFDLEGTLIESYMAAPGKKYNHMQPLAGRNGALGYLLLSGHQVAIVTNQGGVGYGLLGEDEVHKRLEHTRGVLGLPETVKTYVCMHHPNAKDPKWKDPKGLDRRMPKPQMLFEAMVDHGELPDSTVFVCDFHGHKNTAHGTGITHLTWEQFSQQHLPAETAVG